MRVLRPPETYLWEASLTKAQLLDLFKQMHRGFYGHPSTLMRTLLGLRTTAELKHILFGGLQLARMELLRADSREI